MMAVLLFLTYPLVILSRLLNAVLGRDPLRFAEPKERSLWIVRESSSSDAAYFNETSPAEGAAHGGFGRVPESILLRVARWYAPSRSQPREKFTAANREQGIPDEMYTLW
jgi:hypothetical protein